MPLLRSAVSVFALLAASQAQAGLLGYWNFDGPPTVVQGTDNAAARQADTSVRLKDLSGKNYHGNDRNIATIGTRVLFNNNDVPRAPFLLPPGNNNYCLDLTGGNRFVTMEGATGIAAAGAVTTVGNAFNLGNSAAAASPSTIGKLTVAFWWKGVSPNSWGDAVCKGGETYAPRGFQGWSMRRNGATNQLSFTLRNTFGDSVGGMDYMARSGGTLPAPTFNNVAISDTNGQIYSDNIATGMWQHAACVYDGTWMQHYVNGLHVRSQVVNTANTYVGTNSMLSFGQNMIADTNAPFATARYGQYRMDEICVFDEALSPAQIEDLARGADPRASLRTSIRPLDFGWPPPTSARQALSSISPTAAQNASAATDNNVATDYVNLAGRFSGIIVMPTAAAALQSFIVTTSGSLPGRDPVTYEIYGTSGALTSADNSGGRAGGTEDWTLLSTGSLTATAGRQTDMPAVGFTNATAYTNYKVVFPTLASEAVMQISGIRFFPTIDGTGAAAALNASPRALAEFSLPTGHSQSPGQESVLNIRDGVVGTKYLNYAGATSGAIITTGASTVQSFKLTTANDGPGRDPTSYALYGTNDAITSLNNSDGKRENWTLIASARINLPVARSTVGPVIPVTNATSYTSYKLVFPTNGGDVLFQIADIYLYNSTDGTGASLLTTSTPVLAVSNYEMAPNSAGSFVAGYTSGPILTQGGPGTFGVFEMRANGNLKRQDGTTLGTNATVYANESPPLYARFGSANQFQGLIGVTANYPYGRTTSAIGIDFGDDNSSIATGFNTIQTEFLTSSIPTAHDQFFQVSQGCFQVAAPGRYTFTLRGDDGSQFAIAGATWVARYADNGNGSFTGELFQNGFPTGDTNAIAVVEFPAAGCYNFRHVWNEQGGGAWNEVLYAQGERSAYDPALFKQITDSSGGLTLVDHKPIVDLRSTAPFVLSGNPATLTLAWDSSYSTVTTLNGGVFSNQDMTAQTINGYGSITIPSPAVTTTYTLTGTRTGAPHPTVTSSVTVYVDAPPVITSLTVDDNTLIAGAPMTLRWTGLAGTTWSLSDGVNPAVDVTANTSGNPLISQSGTITFAAPATSTTYSLTTTNANGTSNVPTVSVTIGLPPAVTLTVDKSSMLQGSYVQLDWTVSADSTSQSITPRINQSSLSNSVALTGSSIEQPTRTTTYVLSASNIYGATTVSATVTLPERFGVSPAGWTVQVDYWNRFGYTDPVYGNRNALNMGIYQSEEMFAISDATLGERGPAAVSNISATVPTMTGPAVPPTVQPGVGEKILMRYRQMGVPVINHDEGLAAGGNLVGGEVRPPPGATTVGGAAVTFDQYAFKATATLVVNAPGGYTIGINNDDGGRLRVDLNNDGDFNDSGETIVQDETYHGFVGALSFTGSVDLQAGTYPIEYIYFEGAGGSGGEVFFVDTEDACTRKALPIVTSSPTAPVTTDVVISEFMAVNSKTLEDLEGSSPDWIELYNGTAAAISLNGYYLTDNALVPNKWAFPASASIPAGGYLIVFASGKADRIPPPPVSEFHTNFTLGGGIGYVALKKNDGGGGYTNVSSFNYPNQRTDVSYGWYDGTNIGYSATPTPGKLNMGGAASVVRGDTHFDVDRGIKSAAFNLTITATDTSPGTKIRYTTDGSTPTWLNGTDYAAPIPISVTTVIRARAMRAGAVPTNTDTQTYIFPADVLTQNTVTAVSKGWPNQTISGQYFDFGMDSAIVTGHEAEVIAALKAIPTVSMVTDITSLTDPTCGIFVESQFRGRAFERATSIELINDNGDLGGNFQIEAGVRSRGGFSRNDGNPKHSWHLYFRNDPGYGGRLKYPMFGTDGTSRFQQLDLATANNYSWSFSPEAGNVRTFGYNRTSDGTAQTFRWRYNTFIRDAAAHDLQGQMSGLTTRNKYVHLYINGQYWGLHYIEERAEASHAEQYLGGDKDNYDVVKSAGNTNGYQTEVTDGDYTRGITGTATADGTYISQWSKLYGGAWDLRQRNGNTVSQAATDDRNIRFYKLLGYDYNPGTQTATRNLAYPVLLDVNNLVDYMLLTCYCGAYDAPLSTFLNNASNNWTALRDRTGSQGFKYIVWDFEHGMGTDMLSGEITAGTSQDIDYSAAVNTKFMFTPTTNGVTAAFRSTNRWGPWAWSPNGVTPVPRSIWPTNQAWRGAFSATNPEYYQQSNFYNNGNDYARSNPQYINEYLAFSTEFRRMFADRAQSMLRQGGPLTTANVLAKIDVRYNQLVNAVIAESARWGNAKGVALANYDKQAWIDGVENVREWVRQGSNQHVLRALPINEGATPNTPRVGTGVAGPGRAEVMIQQLRNYRDGGLNNVGTAGPYWVVNSLFPGIDAPLLSQYGGVVAVNTMVTLTNPNSTLLPNETVYYSASGVDPRPLGGGAPGGGATSIGPNGTENGPVTLTATGTLVARVYDTSTLEWSALSKADFVVGTPASSANLVVTEINYNPRDLTPGTPTAGDIQTFEFIELMNTSTGPIDLSGVRFTTGITYTFPTGRVLTAGERIVVAKDLTAFASRYPDGSYAGLSAKTVGPFDGNFDNGGERIVLTALNNSTIADITYNDSPPWPTTPDGATGNGATLVFRTACGNTTAIYGDPLSWYGHQTVRGNPGGPDGDAYASWAAANSASSDGAGDSDSDGISDLLEYLFGSNPSTTSSVTLLPTAGTADFTVGLTTDKYQTLTYTRRIALPDITSAVEVCDDLMAANWTATAVLVSRTDNGNGTETIVYRAPLPLSGDNRNFMRVHITCNPIP